MLDSYSWLYDREKEKEREGARLNDCLVVGRVQVVVRVPRNESV